MKSKWIRVTVLLALLLMLVLSERCSALQQWLNLLNQEGQDTENKERNT